MQPSLIKIDRRLCGAFIFYLKHNGYVCSPSKNKLQPYLISHSETLTLTHIIEIDRHRNWIVPKGLQHAVWSFSSVSSTYRPIKTCEKCSNIYHVVECDFVCPKCQAPHIPF